MHFTPTAVLEVILMLPPLGIYIDGEARHVNYRFSSLLAPGNKIVPIIAFGRRFLVELPSRSSWLVQEKSEILQSEGVIFYTDGSLCESRAVAGVFSDT
jgi:hypothetical protein